MASKKSLSEELRTLIFAIVTGLIGFPAIYGGIKIAEIAIILIGAVLALFSVLTFSKYIQLRRFKKKIIKPQKENSQATETRQEHKQIESPVAYNIPSFAWKEYDKDSIPELSGEALKLWESIYGRIRKMGINYTKGLFLIMILNWILMVAASMYYGSDHISFSDHQKFTAFSAGLALLLVFAKMRISMAQGVPMLLSIVWLAHPIVKGLKGFSKSTEMSPQLMKFFIIGGLIIILVWVLFRKIQNKKFRQGAEGTPSARLLFLWVFRTESASQLVHNVGYKWRILGPIFFLNGAGLMSIDDAKLAAKIFTRKKVMIRNEADLKEQIEEFSYVPDKYGFHKVQSVLCGDNIWKQTLDFFIENNDLVLMSLCGYTEKNRGCEFEIRKLIDNIPSKNFVFMVNENTDMNELKKDFSTFWAKMSPNSPNLNSDQHQIRLYNMSTLFMDELEEQERQSGESTEGAKAFQRLKSLGEDGDKIVKILCQQLTERAS